MGCRHVGLNSFSPDSENAILYQVSSQLVDVSVVKNNDTLTPFSQFYLGQYGRVNSSLEQCSVIYHDQRCRHCCEGAEVIPWLIWE